MTSKAWPDATEIDKQYDAIRVALADRSDVEETLKKGLHNPHTRALALEMMFDLPVKYTLAFAPEVFDDATSTGGHFDLARDLLARVDSDEATDILRPLVNERLSTDDHTWEAYLRSAEVLGELGQDNLLNDVVARARMSSDPDVLMTAEMFDTGSFGRLDRIALREDRGGLPF